MGSGGQCWHQTWVCVHQVAQDPGGGFHWAAFTTAIAAVIAAGGTIFAGVAAYYAGRQVLAARTQLQAEEATRQTTTLIDVCRRWDDPNLLDARMLTQRYRDPEQLHRMVRHWSSGGTATYFQALREPNFFEDLAILLKHNAITFEALRDLFGELIVETYDHWRPTIEAWQSATPSTFENFQALADRMRRARE